MRPWLPVAMLLAILFIAAAIPGTFVPTGPAWLFPIGQTNTISLTPGLQIFWGLVKLGFGSPNYTTVSGAVSGLPPIIGGDGSDINVGIQLTSKGSSPVDLYPGLDSLTGVRIMNASQTTSEITVNTSDHVTTIDRVQIGSASALTMVAKTEGMLTSSTSGSNIAPGAAGMRMEAVCGTSAGTLAIIVYAGTSTVSSTIINNVGSGVTGC